MSSNSRRELPEAEAEGHRGGLVDGPGTMSVPEMVTGLEQDTTRSPLQVLAIIKLIEDVHLERLGNLSNT